MKKAEITVALVVSILREEAEFLELYIGQVLFIASKNFFSKSDSLEIPRRKSAYFFEAIH